MQFHPRSIAVTTACMFAVWGAYAVTAWAQEPSAKKPERLVPVGLQKQLLVDDFVIAEKHNVTRTLGTVQKHGIVLKPTLPTDFIPPLGQRQDEDYEDDLKTGRKPDGSPVALDFGYYTTVLRNEKEDKFQMWYMAWRLAGVGSAESKDGNHWTKPLVGKDGKNNIVHSSQGFSCSIDPNLPWGHPEKYKGAADFTEENSQVGICQSADGIHWSEYNNVKHVNEIRFACQWTGDQNLSSLKGKVIKLRFHLRHTKLYSFTIRASST